MLNKAADPRVIQQIAAAVPSHVPTRAVVGSLCGDMLTHVAAKLATTRRPAG
jgi:hypothetical protein